MTHSEAVLPRKTEELSLLLNEPQDTPESWDQWNFIASLRRGIPLKLLILDTLTLSFTQQITHKGFLTV